MGVFINFYRRIIITTHRDFTLNGRVYRLFNTKRSRKRYLSRPKLKSVLDHNQIIPVDDIEEGTNKPIRYYENMKDPPEDFVSALIYLGDVPRLVHTAVRDIALRRVLSASVEPGPRTASGFSPHQSCIPNPVSRRPLSSATSFRHSTPCPNKPITLPRSKIIDTQTVTEEQAVEEVEPFDMEAWLAELPKTRNTRRRRSASI
ncbi:hypothetical protein MMC14_001534 [Varicellaria rhodocarpa]|nr:hypothetical protein [Varicellaria rhodocarpa]